MAQVAPSAIVWRSAQPARAEIEAKLLQRDGHWHGYQVDAMLAQPRQPVQMKGLSVDIAPRTLSAADKANGITWQGRVKVTCETYRLAELTYDRKSVKGTWDKWQDGGQGVPVFATDTFPYPAITLTIRGEKWQWSVAKAPKPDASIIPQDSR